MMKRTFKRQLGIFTTSFLITACAILFSLSFVTIEKNTGEMLGSPVSAPFALDFKENVATVTVSDRDYTFSLERGNEIVTSKSSALLFTFLLVL